MSILDFKSALLGGGARPNQYRVELAFPAFVSGGSTAGQKAQFLCSAASLPGSDIGVTSVFYRGREVKLPGERRFNNWTIRITNDTDFAIHTAFESWMNAINHTKENSGITNASMITTQMSVTQLDRNNVALKKYSFADVWPVSMGDIQLSFNANDQIEEFDVQLAYAWWEVGETNGLFGGTIGINTPVGGVGISI
jgi:hypothetical protein